MNTSTESLKQFADDLRSQSTIYQKIKNSRVQSSHGTRPAKNVMIDFSRMEPRESNKIKIKVKK